MPVLIVSMSFISDHILNMNIMMNERGKKVTVSMSFISDHILNSPDDKGKAGKP